MKLAEWFRSRRPPITQDAFGMKIGVTQGRVSQIIKNGTHDLPIALAIERETAGAVTVSEVLPDALRRPTAEPADQAAGDVA